MVFSITICGPLLKSKINTILNYLQQSWQSDASNGGLGLNSPVLIVYKEKQEFYSDDS